MRQPSRALDLFLTRTGFTVTNVVAQRIVEQHGVLRHDADCRTQAGLLQAADILAVNRDSAAADVIKTKQQSG